MSPNVPFQSLNDDRLGIKNILLDVLITLKSRWVTIVIHSWYQWTHEDRNDENTLIQVWASWRHSNLDNLFKVSSGLRSYVECQTNYLRVQQYVGGQYTNMHYFIPFPVKKVTVMWQLSKVLLDFQSIVRWLMTDGKSDILISLYWAKVWATEKKNTIMAHDCDSNKPNNVSTLTSESNTEKFYSYLIENETLLFCTSQVAA